MAKSKVWSFRAEPDFFSEGTNLKRHVQFLRFKSKSYKKKYVRLRLAVDEFLEAEKNGEWKDKVKALARIKAIIEIEDTG